MSKIKKSEKSYTVAVIISGLFGIVGLHHFYLDRYIMGIIDLSMFIIFIVLIILQLPLLAYIVLAVDRVHTIFVTYWLLVIGLRI